MEAIIRHVATPESQTISCFINRYYALVDAGPESAAARNYNKVG